MIVLRKDKLGRIHYKLCNHLTEVDQAAIDIGADDGDDVIVVQETLHSQTVWHFIVKREFNLVAKSDHPHLHVR